MCCSGGLYVVPEVYTDAQDGCALLRGLYAVQGGYMLFRRVILMFRGLFAAQGWYLLFRMAIICKKKKLISMERCC